jgi:hypothetical protein
MTQVLLLVGLITYVSGALDEPPQQPENWAENLFGTKANRVHDFGTVPHGAQLHHDFVVTNIYTVPIQITDIRTSMGVCTMVADKQILQPNEKATLRVRMDTSLFVGKKTGSLFVSFGPNFAQTRLAVTAGVRQDVVCNPGEVAFGTVAAGKVPSATLKLDYAGPQAWRIMEVVVPNDLPVEAKVKELNRGAGKVGYQLTVWLKKDAPVGHFQDNIFLKTNEPTGELLPIFVQGNIQGERKSGGN